MSAWGGNKRKKPQSSKKKSIPLPRNPHAGWKKKKNPRTSPLRSSCSKFSEVVLLFNILVSFSIFLGSFMIFLTALSAATHVKVVVHVTCLPFMDHTTTWSIVEQQGHGTFSHKPRVFVAALVAHSSVDTHYVMSADDVDETGVVEKILVVTRGLVWLTVLLNGGGEW